MGSQVPQNISPWDLCVKTLVWEL